MCMGNAVSASDGEPFHEVLKMALDNYRFLYYNITTDYRTL